MHGTFFQYSMFSGLNKSEIGSNADFFLPCYSIELNETFDFTWFNLIQRKVLTDSKNKTNKPPKPK